MATEFNYSIQNDFPNQAVDATVLTVEIEASTIVADLDGITINGDSVELLFVLDLSVPETMMLDQIVAVHQGVPFNNGPQRVNAIAVQDNATNLWQTAVTLDMDPIGFDQYVLTFFCEIRTTGGNNNSQAQYQVLLDGSDVAQGGVEGKTFFDSRSGSLTVSTARGAAPVIEMQWRQTQGTATTAQIRRARIAATPVGEESG